MKQHAVPQEIMSVEFNLFGSMNIRQFGYVAGAGGLGYFSYLILPGFLKWVGAVVFIIIGLTLAFAPGFDSKAKNFLLAIKRPTRRVWKKTPNAPDFMRDLPMESYTVGHSLSAVSKEVGDKASRVFNSQRSKEESLEEEIQNVDQELETLQKEVSTVSNKDAEVQSKTATGLTSLPNVVNGQVVDSNGNSISGALVVVTDSTGKSISAVKTNTDGVFLSSKQLPLGKYSLNYVVNNKPVSSVSIVANGSILPFTKLQSN